MSNEIETFFMTKKEFDEVKGRLKFENPSIIHDFKPEEEDVIALDFTINSTPTIKGLEILKGGDFVSFWAGRFEKEGLTKRNLSEAFALE